MKKQLALFGLKFNPFLSDVPTEALHVTPRMESFSWRIVNGHVRDGGFALIVGDPGTGKSVTLRKLHEDLGRLRDVTAGALVHPQCSLGDFYRELGDLFGVELKPSNRWGGFKALREKWQLHVESTLTRPVLLVDEAQEISSSVLNELRILASTHFDSKILLSVVMAGDRRLQEKLRHEDLMSLGSRIRTRLVMEHATKDELLACLKHLLSAAGNAKLMTPELTSTLCEHSLGNYRVLMTMSGELLAAGSERECTQLDEKLFFDVIAMSKPAPSQSQSAPQSSGKVAASSGKRR